MTVPERLQVGDVVVEVAAGPAPACRALETELRTRFSVTNEPATIMLVLGGDGAMLHAAQTHLRSANPLPLYGMNCGHAGFLMNSNDIDTLPDRLLSATPTWIPALDATAHTTSGTAKLLGFNDAVVYRASGQAVKLKVSVSDKVRINELVGDGILVATPAGSTAYNLSASGPIVPLGSPLLALTPICAHRPRRWPGALLDDAATVVIDVLDFEHRPAAATVDSAEMADVTRLVVRRHDTLGATLAFDPGHNLSERILAEQFA